GGKRRRLFHGRGRWWKTLRGFPPYVCRSELARESGHAKASRASSLLQTRRSCGLGIQKQKAPLPKQRGFPVHLQRVAALLVPGTVAVLILDPGGQAHLIEQRQERLGRQLFDVDH